jgi:hypothetical protein
MQPIYSFEELPLPCWKCQKWVEEEVASGPPPYYCSACSSETSVVEEISRMQAFLKGLIGIVVLENGPNTCGKYTSEAARLEDVNRRFRSSIEKLFNETAPLDIRLIDLALDGMSNELKRQDIAIRQASPNELSLKDPKETSAKVRQQIEELINQQIT